MSAYPEGVSAMRHSHNRAMDVMLFELGQRIVPRFTLCHVHPRSLRPGGRNTWIDKESIMYINRMLTELFNTNPSKFD
jgi:hypothetical protein